MRYLTGNEQALSGNIKREVVARGLQPVARDLGMPKTSVAAVAAGFARPGTMLLASVAWDAYQARKASPETLPPVP